MRERRFSAIKVRAFFLLASNVILASKFTLLRFSGILYVKQAKYLELFDQRVVYFYTATSILIHIFH